MPATGLKKLIFQVKDSAGSVVIFANRCHWVSLQLCFFLLPFFSVMTIKNTCNFIGLWAQIFAKKVFFLHRICFVCVCDIDSVVELTMEDRLLIEKQSGPENWATWNFQMEHLMKAKGLWGMVVETENVPEGANAQSRAEFEKQKKKKGFLCWC